MSVVLYMDAVITPNRSLSMRGFFWLIGVLAFFNLAVAGLMIVIGAFPVPIFLGLDLLGVIIAFRASYRSGRQAERVQVSAAEVRVLLQAFGRSRTIWTRMPPQNPCSRACRPPAGMSAPWRCGCFATA